FIYIHDFLLLYRPFGKPRLLCFVGSFSSLQFSQLVFRGGFVMKRLPMISFLFLVLCATTVVAQSANAAGTWDATLTSPQGTFNVQLILKQDGEKLSGV